MAIRLSASDAAKLGLTPPANAKTPLLPLREGWLVLPFPPSVNRYWRQFRGRAILSKVARTYHTDVAGLVLEHYREVPTVVERCAVVIEAYPPDYRARDLDNLQKAILDSLQRCGLLADDELIDDLTIRRRCVSRDTPRVEVRIEPVKGGEAC